FVTMDVEPADRSTSTQPFVRQEMVRWLPGAAIVRASGRHTVTPRSCPRSSSRNGKRSTCPVSAPPTGSAKPGNGVVRLGLPLAANVDQKFPPVYTFASHLMLAPGLIALNPPGA